MAERLTEAQVDGLRAVEAGKPIGYFMAIELLRRGLVTAAVSDRKGALTNAGRSALTTQGDGDD